MDQNKLKEIINQLEKENVKLYELIEEKNKLIEMQKHYIWELLKEKEE